MRTIDGARGFTYLWVLMLVAAMGLGLTVAVEIDATAARRDREQELLAIGRQFQRALASYAAAGPAGAAMALPPSLEDLLQDKRVPGVRRHLRKVFVDPVTGRAAWGFVMVGGGIAGVHSLSDQVPLKQDGFFPDQSGLRAKQKYSEWIFMNDIGPRQGTLPPAGTPVVKEATP